MVDIKAALNGGIANSQINAAKPVFTGERHIIGKA